ncbi:cupredoxin domain-containing protein [Natronobiforma cellulositropha]|uniref:cupredoxin domain-containing protein n=1 Tax=Natronobiforma cellulositropha TaxID=1679076 RepID=UPI0021D592A9|nr:plastocyanin/azurin family copper-binding protein [Natronobiforma cellulositropha]
MHRRAYIASLGTVIAAALAGCTALGDVGEELFGAEYDIGMSRNEFLPETFETTVGEPVVWKNTSGADHTVTALERSLPDGAAYFASGGFEDEDTARAAWHDSFGGRIAPRETYTHTFEVPGTYGYICEPHVGGGMIGTVVVTEPTE